MLGILTVGLTILARVAAAEHSQSLAEPIGDLPSSSHAMLSTQDARAAEPGGASPSDDSAQSVPVAPELRPALAVATAVLRAISQTAPGSNPNAARLRDAAAALLAEGALGRLLAEDAVVGALRQLLPVPRDAQPSGERGDATVHSQPATSSFITTPSAIAAESRAAQASGSNAPTSHQASSTSTVNGAAASPRRLQASAGGARCPETRQVLEAATAHGRIDFTSGYADNAHCEWAVRCSVGPAALLRFTALDTEQDWDFVSLYNGDSAEAPRVAQLSGTSVPVVAFGARDGELLVVFESDSSAAAEGFVAEYWCSSADSPGCTDLAALNFDPAATADDGSCRFDDTAALLAAFHVDPAGRAAWDALHGWNTTSDTCADGWEGVTCDEKRVSVVGLSGKSQLRFTLGPTLGNLTRLEEMDLSVTRLSGTLPESVGHMWSLMYTGLYSTRLSGTLPESVGNLARLEHTELYGTRLSGTLPESIGQLRSLRIVDLKRTRLSGTLPESVGQLRNLVSMCLYSTRLSGTLPASVGQLRSLERIDLHDAGFSGPLPSLANCISLVSLRLSANGFTRLPPALPPSLTHLYLNANPLNATAAELSVLTATLPSLHALSVGFVSVPMVLEMTSGLPCNGWCYGTRVTPPRDCRVGEACSWELALHDADDEAGLTGGLLTGLALGLDCSCDRGACTHQHLSDDHNRDGRDDLSTCSRTTPMSDNRNGTFTATAPADWVASKGPHEVRFFHDGLEFRPTLDDSDDFQAYDSLHSADYGPRMCPAGSHTEPDAATGAECVCVPGFEPDAVGTTKQVASCHRSCSNGTVVTPQGDGCECGKGSYDTEAFGALLCFAGDWADSADSATFAAVSADRAQGLRCSDCPEACAVCDSGVPTLRAGWRLNASTSAEFVALMADGVSGRPQYVFRCPSAESETGGCPPLGLQPVEHEEAELQSDMEIAEAAMSTGQLDAAAADVEAAERLATVVVDGLQCLGNHTGRMCAPCSAGFFLKASDDSCVSCTVPEASASSVLSVVLSGLLLMGGAAALWRNHRRIRRVKAEFSTNLKIVLGLMQVLVLLKDTLSLVFPSEPREMLSMAAVFTADFQGLMNLECSGWSWEGRWAMSVFGVPLLGALGVVTQYLWHRRKHDDIAQTTQGAVDSGFLCVMVLYPRVSTVVLSALRCRDLGPELSVLDADYSVACDHGMEGLAWAMALVWPVGIPVGLLCLLWRQWRLSREQWVESELQLTVAAEAESGSGASGKAEQLSAPTSLAEFNAERIRGSFGFCTKDFRPAAFFWEPLDMLRKLALSGLLQFVDRGTAFQVFCGCVLAFCSCAAQIKVAPYAEPASNLLKALVEAQIFVTFLISFILRVLPTIRSSEPVSDAAYGWVLVVTLSGLLVTSVGLTAHQIWLRHRGRRHGSDGDGGEGGEVVLEMSEGLVLERGLGSRAK
eukprot:COSAG06_NODE_442_length_15715_cov_16.651639_11_plen_1438_part_00